jgi:wyosine [tRNA(Phe)-imidazoG37] synthetase (radical SAM superfamily)
MSTIALKKEIIYGPVNSRRLGTSLGVNIMPFNIKICSFDCLYCQYGWTSYHTNVIERNFELPSVGDISAALERALNAYSANLNTNNNREYPLYVTFSGNGEPTLHPQFPQIVDEVIKIRNKVSLLSRTAILSNSTKVNEPDIITALSKLDVRIMKLDAGNEDTFRSYNNPAIGISLDNITEGLAALKDVTIQTLFTGGEQGNYNDKNISDWIIRLKQISPIKVQLYSLDRGYPSKNITHINKDLLLKIKLLLEKQNIASEVYER